MPKVLIENDSNSATWYYGKKGQLFDFTHAQHGHYFVDGFDNDGPAGVHYPDGRLVYTESEYEELLSQRDKAIDDLVRHAQSIVDLQNEKLRLQQEVDDAMDVQKVELPREVAEAIEKCRSAWAKSANPYFHFLSPEYFGQDNVGMVLKKFAYERPLDYMNALVNGYTIEKTPAEKFHAKVESLLYEWLHSPAEEPEDLSLLAERIVEHAEELIT
ncbi:DUF1642 domain-containing protein [Paenibacillus sp. FSL W8-1287]|uniref:DUF1642 domain-containing protein n=1 Tax=Paenibacillus sp. FSL W8-1287 TaxID=2954653 RepID=UPI0030D28054